MSRVQKMYPLPLIDKARDIIRNWGIHWDLLTLWFSDTESRNIIMFMDLPLSVFHTVPLGSIRGLSIEQVHISTGISREKINKLLMDYTVWELISGKEIKVLPHKENTFFGNSSNI